MISKFITWLIKFLFSDETVIVDDRVSDRWINDNVYRTGKEGKQD